jgi:hypothetical protein
MAYTSQRRDAKRGRLERNASAIGIGFLETSPSVANHHDDWRSRDCTQIAGVDVQESSLFGKNLNN